MKQYKSGDKAYPVDNSFSITKGTNECPFLAGTFENEPKLVEIVGEPYIEKITFLDDEIDYEFRDVLYDGKLHRVSNHFKDSFDEIDHSGFRD